MQGLKYKSWRAKIFFQRFKLVRNIVYTGIEASKKDCLCKGLIVWTWARKQGKGNARWMFCIHLCWNHLLWAFAAGVLWKTQPWDIFARARTGKCIKSCNHDGCLEDNYCVLFFKLKFLIPTLRYMFCLPKASKIYGESRKISQENIYFYGLKKETFISNGRKI